MTWFILTRPPDFSFVRFVVFFFLTFLLSSFYHDPTCINGSLDDFFCLACLSCSLTRVVSRLQVCLGVPPLLTPSPLPALPVGSLPQGAGAAARE